MVLGRFTKDNKRAVLEPMLNSLNCLSTEMKHSTIALMGGVETELINMFAGATSGAARVKLIFPLVSNFIEIKWGRLIKIIQPVAE